MCFLYFVIISSLKRLHLIDWYDSVVCRIGNNSDIEQIWIPVNKRCFVSSLTDIGSVVLDKIFFFVDVFPLYTFLFMGKGLTLHGKKIESPVPKNGLCKYVREVRPASGRLGVRIPGATDLRRSKTMLTSPNKWEFPSGTKTFKQTNKQTQFKNIFCKVWLKLAFWFWRKFFIWISSMYSRYFIIIYWKCVASLEQTRFESCFFNAVRFFGFTFYL